MHKVIVFSLSCVLACTAHSALPQGGDEGTTGARRDTSDASGATSAGDGAAPGSTAPASESSGDASSGTWGSGGTDSRGSDGGGSTEESGSTGELVEASDADAVQWPEACLEIAQQPIVCLTFGATPQIDSVLLALNPETGDVCPLHALPGWFWDMPYTMVWQGNRLAHARSSWISGAVVDLSTGDRVEIEFDGVEFYEWAGGILVDDPAVALTDFFVDIDALQANVLGHVYDLGPLYSRGFVLEDALHTFEFNAPNAVAVTLPGGAAVEPIVLEDAPLLTQAMTAFGDRIFVVDYDGTLYTYDDGGALLGTLPIAHGHVRGLACSAGITASW